MLDRAAARDFCELIGEDPARVVRVAGAAACSLEDLFRSGDCGESASGLFSGCSGLTCLCSPLRSDRLSSPVPSGCAALCRNVFQICLKFHSFHGRLFNVNQMFFYM